MTGSTSSGRPAFAGRIEALDVLRFVAAVGVLLYHYVSSYAPKVSEPPDQVLVLAAHATRYGYLGVNLFFMISGFVILWSSSGRSATAFAIGRVSRLFPSFWASIILASCLLLLIGSMEQAAVVTGRNLIANATMVPTFLGSPRIDDVYWTLELELQFYVLVFAILASGQMARVESWVVGWLGLMALQMVIGGGRLVGVVTLAPFGPFFAAGCVFFLVKRGGLTAGRAVALAAAGAMCLYQAWSGRRSFVSPDAVSAVVVPSIVATFFVAFWWLSNSSPREKPASRVAAAVGELTYPLYLTHATLGALVLPLYPVGLNTGFRVILTTVLAMGVAAAMAYVDRSWRARMNAQLNRLAARVGLSQPAAVRPTS